MGGVLVNQDDASELVDGEPSMSKDVTAEDLRPLNSPQANTALKPRGVKGNGSATRRVLCHFMFSKM